jgi:hypothetical protein
MTPPSPLTLATGTIWGQRDGEAFFQTGVSAERTTPHLRATPEVVKIAVILSNPLPPPAPGHIEVRGREIRSGTVKSFMLSHLLTTDVPYGGQWGTNFEFPTRGCWELAVDVPGNRGKVTVAVD